MQRPVQASQEWALPAVPMPDATYSQVNVQTPMQQYPFYVPMQPGANWLTGTLPVPYQCMQPAPFQCMQPMSDQTVQPTQSEKEQEKESFTDAVGSDRVIKPNGSIKSVAESDLRAYDKPEEVGQVNRIEAPPLRSPFRPCAHLRCQEGP